MSVEIDYVIPKPLFVVDLERYPVPDSAGLVLFRLEPKYTCKSCNQDFTSIISLGAHGCRKPYPLVIFCADCGKEFSMISELICHLRIKEQKKCIRT